MNPKVYLAGPIKGLNYDEATIWREVAKERLAESNIDAMSPMRGKEYLKPLSDVGGDKLKDCYDKFPLSTMQAIVARDFNDCTKCDAVIMYLKGAKAVSIGSVCEVAWAHAARVPVILVMEKSGNVHEHGFIRQLCAIHVETLEEAINATKAVLLP